MAQTANNNMTAREASLARRRAMSTAGKAALTNTDRTVSAPAGGGSAPSARAASTPAPRASGMDARTASRARRRAMSTGGKAALPAGDRTRYEQVGTATPTAAPSTPAPASNTDAGDCGCGCGGNKAEDMTQADAPRASRSVARGKAMTQSTARSASRARRQAMSQRGKAGMDSKSMSAAQATRAANPNLSSRELAKAVRDERCKKGGAGQKKSAPVGRPRPGKVNTGAAEDAPWKVGASETAHGQLMTGTMVGRSAQVTGDEPSTCRNITGTEYLGADVFREFCASEPGKPARKVGMSATTHGNSVTGNRLGRSGNVTGNEPGSCKNVTGDEYLGNDHQAFCGTGGVEPSPSKITSSQSRGGKSVTGNNVGVAKSVTGNETGAGRKMTGTQYMQRDKNGRNVPAKVGTSTTLRGGSMTGTQVGRSGNVTGNEPGSCKNVTGDDYLGQEHYQGFCEKTPTPSDHKVGVSRTLRGEGVTGTQTGRSGKVTGDEPGTCKAVTGTPYAGVETYEGYCRNEDTSMSMARARRPSQNVGAVMTGTQPGIGGDLTGASRGACEPLTGTPYLGADQYAQVCPSTPAETHSPDFPQPLTGAAPWGQFSVNAPSHASQDPAKHSSVTGSSYESGNITGPFGMAGGKVTGTEEARFGNGGNQVIVPTPQPQMVEGRVKSRVTGEGMEAGMRITGDDWDRGDRVTGTEGMSATRRNPTRRGGGSSVMPMPAQQEPKRNEDLPVPNSKVTGGSGNTEKGAFITYSGGARG